MASKQKGFHDYLRDDPTLAEKYTYDEFYNQKASAPTNNDVSINKAYASYLEICAELEKMPN